MRSRSKIPLQNLFFRPVLALPVSLSVPWEILWNKHFCAGSLRSTFGSIIGWGARLEVEVSAIAVEVAGDFQGSFGAGVALWGCPSLGGSWVLYLPRLPVTACGCPWESGATWSEAARLCWRAWGRTQCEPSAASTPNIRGAVCTRGDTAEGNVYEQLHNFTKNKSPSRKSKGFDIRHLNSSAIFNLFLILSEPWFSPSLKWG